MPGRLQKVAALAVAASLFAASTFADDPLGPGARSAAISIDVPLTPSLNLLATMHGDPPARLDRRAAADTFEVGLRRRWPYGVETTVSMFRAKAELELLPTGENAITELSRPTVRQGIRLDARYDPAAWLTLDLRAAALHARYADGAAEYIPGAAERNAAAMATLRVRDGWTASFLLSYLGKRHGIDESASLRASTFVDARFTREVSKRTRVQLDFFNVFGQRLRDVDHFSAARAWRGAADADNFVAHPAEPRGLLLGLRTTF